MENNCIGPEKNSFPNEEKPFKKCRPRLQWPSQSHDLHSVDLHFTGWSKIKQQQSDLSEDSYINGLQSFWSKIKRCTLSSSSCSLALPCLGCQNRSSRSSNPHSFDLTLEMSKYLLRVWRKALTSRQSHFSKTFCRFLYFCISEDLESNILRKKWNNYFSYFPILLLQYSTFGTVKRIVSVLNKSRI